LVFIFGPSASGKTLVVLEMIYRIAHGKPFMGRRTRQGAVLYIALEGQAGLDARVLAVTRRHGDPGKRIARLTVPVALGSGAGSQASVARIISAAKSLARQSGYEVAAIVVDTFARALAGGNEASEASAAMAQANRISAATGAAMIFVHHPGKDRGCGGRQHNFPPPTQSSTSSMSREPRCETFTCARPRKALRGG
jgi:RecA-family ATPase